MEASDDLKAKAFSDEELKQFDKRYGSEHVIARFKATITADRKVIEHWQDGFNKAENRIGELEGEIKDHAQWAQKMMDDPKSVPYLIMAKKNTDQATTIKELEKIVKDQCDPEDYQAMIVECDLQAADIKRLRGVLGEIGYMVGGRYNQTTFLSKIARKALDRKEE